MKKKFNLDIPSKSLTYLLICGGIIILIVLLGIIPLNRYNAKRSQEIKTVQNQIVRKRDWDKLTSLYKVSLSKKKHIFYPTLRKQNYPDRMRKNFRMLSVSRREDPI